MTCNFTDYREGINALDAYLPSERNYSGSL